MRQLKEEERQAWFEAQIERVMAATAFAVGFFEDDNLVVSPKAG